MSYQVLARKWRPRTFSEMVGQEHVLRALINALDNDRVHHAFLFTGTRGVGKTTIARILAKSLNCETGVSSKPCGECSACREIDEGRFVDLIEVDAASRTKVEDTRELLENVQYAPTRGRYKVYLVDEVHMLSAHSFNALLKTLEEPPPHVKFLLATTDPQKLPVTILSRCLQFNLKRLPVNRIAEHLEHILKAEGVAYAGPALQLVARSADGSMRDALSLLDQAIAFGGGEVSEAEVRMMLGTIEQEHVLNLLEALAGGDAGALLERVGQVAEFSPDWGALLGEMLSTLHRVALAQMVPEAIDDSLGDREPVMALAVRMAPEEVQLYYQIGLLGRRDLPLAPDARGGFEMALLRMLAFTPDGAPSVAAASPAPGPAARPAPAAAAAPAARPAAPAGRPGSAREALSRAMGEKGGRGPASPPPSPPPAPVRNTPREASTPAAASPPPAAADEESDAGGLLPPQREWAEVVQALGLSGAALHLAANCVFLQRAGDLVALQLDPVSEHLRSPNVEQRLKGALGEYLGTAARLEIRVEAPAEETPAQRAAREKGERQAEAVAALENDHNVQELKRLFDARLVLDQVQPIDL